MYELLVLIHEVVTPGTESSTHHFTLCGGKASYTVELLTGNAYMSWIYAYTCFIY